MSYCCYYEKSQRLKHHVLWLSAKKSGSKRKMGQGIQLCNLLKKFHPNHNVKDLENQLHIIYVCIQLPEDAMCNVRIKTKKWP